jgi:hypothetical protein
MKKVYLLVSLAVFVGFILQSCSKDSPLEILPNANVVLTDGDSTQDDVNMGTVAGVKRGELMVITGTKLVDTEKKLLIYIKGDSDGSYPVNISANSLLSFNLETINSNTVIYYVSKTEYYLLVDGEITLSNTEQKMMSGTFSGKVIPAHELTSNVTLEKILSLYDGNRNITGDFRTYSIKL